MTSGALHCWDAGARVFVVGCSKRARPSVPRSGSPLYNGAGARAQGVGWTVETVARRASAAPSLCLRGARTSPRLRGSCRDRRVSCAVPARAPQGRESCEVEALYDARSRRANGSEGARLFRSADDPNELVVLLKWDDVSRGRTFAGPMTCDRRCRAPVSPTSPTCTFSSKSKMRPRGVTHAPTTNVTGVESPPAPRSHATDPRHVVGTRSDGLKCPRIHRGS